MATVAKQEGVQTLHVVRLTDEEREAAIAALEQREDAPEELIAYLRGDDAS